MNKQKIGSILQLILSIVLLVLLFSLIDLRAFIKLIAGIKPLYFAGGLLLFFLALTISAVRWKFILRAAGETVKVLQLTAINLIGSFFSIFLPTAVGGDLARMFETSRIGIEGTKAVSTVLLDRVIGLISLVMIALGALIVGYRYAGERFIVYVVIGFSIGLALGWWLFFNRKLMRRFQWVFRLPLISRIEPSIQGLYESLYMLHNQPGLLISTIFISILAQVIEISSVIFVARALGVQTEIAYFFIFIPLIWIVTMLPISLSGIGLREGAFAFFFGQIGLASIEAVAISLLYFSYRLIAGLVGGGLFLRSSIVDSSKKWFKRNQKIV